MDTDHITAQVDVLGKYPFLEAKESKLLIIYFLNRVQHKIPLVVLLCAQTLQRSLYSYTVFAKKQSVLLALKS